MAYRAYFHSVQTELLSRNLPFNDLMARATPVGHCSHYVVGHPAMKRLLDGGTPIEGARHRLVTPHFRLFNELPDIRQELLMLLDTDFKGDEFFKYEINGFVTACDACMRLKTAMITTLQ